MNTVVFSKLHSLRMLKIILKEGPFGHCLSTAVRNPHLALWHKQQIECCRVQDESLQSWLFKPYSMPQSVLSPSHFLFVLASVNLCVPSFLLGQSSPYLYIAHFDQFSQAQFRSSLFALSFTSSTQFVFLASCILTTALCTCCVDSFFVRHDMSFQLDSSPGIQSWLSFPAVQLSHCLHVVSAQ